MARKIEVQIVGDSSSLQRALGQATSHTSKFGSVLSGALKVGAGAAVAGFGALAVATKIGIDEFSDAQRVGAQTAAVLKSTGGAANVTAGQVDKLATSLLDKSGVDDEVIKSGENVLLTFRNIRNEAGKGNDVFNQATKATLDLSVAMGEDMKSASIQVGKALNDPVKGLTSLQRVGVQFSDSQKTLIKRLVDTGNTAGAQKVILHELNKEFGGSAEAAGKTLPGQLDILKERFKNVAGQVVGSFMPLFVQLAKTVLPLVGRAFVAVGNFASQFAKGLAGHGKSSVAGAGQFVRDVILTQIVPAFHAVWGFIKKNVIPIVQQLAGIFRTGMQRIAKVVQQHGPEIRQIFHNVGDIIKNVAKVALPLLRWALTVLLPKAIAVAIPIVKTFTDHLKTISDDAVDAKNDVQRMVNWIKTKVKGIAGPFQPLISAIGKIKSALEWINDHTIQIHIKAPSLPGAAGDILGAVLPEVGGVNALGDLLGHRAGGGPVAAMRPYIVGEHGPELYVPRAAGTIIPNGALSGASDTYVTVLLDGEPVRAMVRAESRRTERSLKAGKGWAPA